MGEIMYMPETPEEFIKDYQFVDTKEYYTNGAELIMVYRVEQMLDHYFRRERNADATPVVHAKWARDENFNTVCTGCGKKLPTFHCYNEETDEEWDEPIDETPFCPNCGAKMD